MGPLGEGWDAARVDATIRYHATTAYELTMQRTALESALIPITAYILVACVEAYRRYPAMMREIAAAADPADLGRLGHRVGNQIDPVRLWSIANFPMTGRTVLGAAGMLDRDDDHERCAVMFDFWERAALAYRGDGSRQSSDAGARTEPFADYVPRIADACAPVDDAERARTARLNALLTSYEFLLWFDTRSGYQDSGPYPLGDGRSLLLRQFVKVGPSDFAWSHEVAGDLAYSTVLLAFVLDGVRFRVSDFGTAVTEPEDYLPHVQAFAAFDTSSGDLRVMDADEQDALAAAVKAAQRRQYRLIAGMERRAKIDAGAYVYFSFLRPFAQLAGVDDRLDWTVPRDSTDLYPLLELIDSSPEMAPLDDPGTYYPPLP